jgi:8-oxo-dGTP pyrophosphatase MutT (NUDIX family)
MRTSQAGLARIRRIGPDGHWQYLVQWSERWRSYSLVGGHVETNETFRECCIREVEEELGLSRSEFTVSEALGTPIRYTAYSHGSGVMTDYCMELFDVELTPQELKRISAVPSNRWLSEQEIRQQATRDHQPISLQVRNVLFPTE